MQQNVNLETLQHILEQYSEDVLSECSRIIYKLLYSINESSLPQDHKIFTSVKVLLNLYEKIYKNNTNSERALPISLIIQIVRNMLQSSTKRCNYPDNNIQQEVLSIVQSVFKVTHVVNFSEALEEFAKIYKLIIDCLCTADKEKKCKSDYLMFNLKVLSTIYSLLESINCERSICEFYKKSRSGNMNECEVYANLVLHGDDNIAIHTLMFLIPGYIDCFKTETVLEVIWKKISNSVTHCTTNYSRAVLILCSFFDKAEIKNKGQVSACLFGDSNYWELLQSVLVKNDPTIRKQGMYLFKRTVDVLHNTNKTIICSKEDITFHWELNLKNELHKIYCDIITVLEFLNEQQVHIIKPIFKLAETLLEKILKCSKVSSSWVFVIYQKALSHESIEVVKWGLTNLLKLPGDFLTKENNAKKSIALLMPVLNSLELYYSSRMAISKELKVFLKEIAPLDNAKVFFCSFIQQMCSLVWSPEALFFVVLALDINNSEIKFPFWGENEISQIRIFVKRTFKTFHKIIRIGIQCKLLKAISAFTDELNVPLKDIVLLISSFPMMNSLHFNSLIGSHIIDWLFKAYSKQEFKKIWDSFKRQELGKEFNEKFISLLFAISYYSPYWELECCDSDWDELMKTKPPHSEAEDALLEIFLLFKDMDRRLYCKKELYDHYILLISHFYEANANEPALVKYTLPHAKNVLLFIRNQLKQISGLQEFHTCQLYLKAFKNIIKIQKSFKVHSKDTISFYTDAVNDLEACLKSESRTSPVGLYSRIKLLQTLLETHPCKVKVSFLASYLLTEVNEPLEKEKTYCQQNKDVQTYWGKMNSEFIEGKWAILEYLIKNNLMDRGTDLKETNNALRTDNLIKLCVEGLSTGGYGVLCPVTSILKDILPDLSNYSEIGEIITSVWKLLMEKKKTDEFKLFFKGFVEMLFQEMFILKGESAQEILIEYADLIFSNPSLTMVNIFMRHIQKIDLAGSSVSLFSHIIGNALIFGPVERKDERLTNSVCVDIDRLRICPVWDAGLDNETIKSAHNWDSLKEMYSWPEKSGDHYTSGEVRARAVERILTFNKDSPTDQAVAKSLMETLIKLESKVSKTRYFGDSHIHRVKHRVMQGLLLLDNFLCLDKDESEKLLNWLCKGLMIENPQPSVRYQQEWLIARMLIKNIELYHSYNFLMENEKFKKKGDLCSYLSILLHFYRLLPPKFEFLIEFSMFSYLLVHQHFEVRLYAQVVFLKLYDLAKSKNLTKIINEWESLYNTLSYAYDEKSSGVRKHLWKLSENFFFKTFHPLEHYSLHTIYMDFPSVTNVGPDEWISTQMLMYCGVDPSKISISLNPSAGSLKDCVTWKRTMDSSHEYEFGDQELKEMSENYQKKLIPAKQIFTSNWDEESTRQLFSEKRDGLIVVGSLIDRIPNLGGLARTCEIFGVSEFVLGSLKYTEDKQFTSLSVTAEKWIVVKEVKPQNLVEYILEKKRDGYTVVGAEQTLHSQPLNTVKFPKKTLLLLGNEKEGISPNLLPLLDICVEIPQMGIIRSLNVHVTGALFIWEYAKQKYFS